jgi:hypothetical protein
MQAFMASVVLFGACARPLYQRGAGLDDDAEELF